MTADAVSVVQLIFTTIWTLFNSWHIPGTNVTPAMMFIFILFGSFVLRVLKKYFGGNDEE